jgi:putative membrane protein
LQESGGISLFLKLLWGTVVYRPYVYGFFICFLFFAVRHLRWRGTFTFLVSSYLIAFGCEYSSTRNGFPFGIYTYIDTMRDRELWISNIPFWDSLSFVFLSYFSWIVAAAIRSPRKPSQALAENWTPVLGGLLMMLLDVVIDPLTLLGDRWFLGKMYYYPQGGSYFGVTISNFIGWFFVGWFSQFVFQKLSQLGLTGKREWNPISNQFIWGAFGIYSGVFLFNLSITGWIGEWKLFVASAMVVCLTLLPVGYSLGVKRGLLPNE